MFWVMKYDYDMLWVVCVVFCLYNCLYGAPDSSDSWLSVVGWVDAVVELAKIESQIEERNLIFVSSLPLPSMI